MGVSFKRSLLAVSIAGALCATTSAYATNGMNLEGYGPEATAMGGASQAYDNGSAAMMNNPATIGLMDSTNRIDVAVGNLRPNITSTDPSGTQNAESSANSFFMPAFGYLRKSSDTFAWGVGVFSQGGMGTTYDANSWLSMGGYLGAFAGEDIETKSEVGVGRVLFPMSFGVNDKLNVGGSVDLVWGGMDIQMIMPGGYSTNPMFAPYNGAPGTFIDFANPGLQVLGKAEGGMVNTLMGAIQGGMLSDVNSVGIAFNTDNKFTGAAKGYGLGAKVGLTYQINPTLSFGTSYHFKTKMQDWKTKDGEATLAMVVNGAATGNTDQYVDVTGKMTVKDFQWPGQFAAGLAYQPSDKWMVAADVKYIQWASVMKDFKMEFQAADNQDNPLAAGFGLGGQSMEVTFFQDWKNQTVLQLGGAYSINNAWTLRGGLNLANNPIPDSYMNPLFPAIIKNHVTGGFGWNITKQDAIDFSLAYAPKVTQTNSNTGVETEHSQTNWQLGYNRRF